MKQLLFLLIFLVSGSVIAQNVGIGTPAPLVKLHVQSGGSGNITPFGPFVVETFSNGYINLLTNEDYESGVLFGNPFHAASGGVIYNPGSTPSGLQFRTNGNISRMVIDGEGRVGIGTTSPATTIDVRRGSAPGGTAQFFGTSFITHINFGADEHTYIRGGKINSNVILNDVTGGKVGVAISDPIEKLDVNGNINLRGVLKIFNNAGLNGQVLMSQGTTLSPSWTYLPVDYDKVILFNSVTMHVLGPGVSDILTGLSHTFTITTPAKVKVDFIVRVALPMDPAETAIDILLNGVVQSSAYNHINTSVTQVVGMDVLSLTAGTHTIAIRGRNLSASELSLIYVSGGASQNKMILQFFRQ